MCSQSAPFEERLACPANESHCSDPIGANGRFITSFSCSSARMLDGMGNSIATAAQEKVLVGRVCEQRRIGVLS